MASVEIEVEQECCNCCADCKYAEKPEPAESKDALLTQLKALLNNNSANGMADRMLKIDELMSQISDLGEKD